MHCGAHSRVINLSGLSHAYNWNGVTVSRPRRRLRGAARSSEARYATRGRTAATVVSVAAGYHSRHEDESRKAQKSHAGVIRSEDILVDLVAQTGRSCRKLAIWARGCFIEPAAGGSS